MLSIVLLSFFGIVNLFLGFQKNKNILLPAAFIFTLIVFAANLVDFNQPIDVFGEFNTGMLTIDKITVGFTAIILVANLLVILLADKYILGKQSQPAEYFSILMLSTVGAIMMVSYDHLLILFLGVETLSIPMYVLAGAEKRNLRSNEAALKYFLMGAFATGFLLFGVALVYGATGAFSLAGIKEACSAAEQSPLLILGLGFLLIGMLFKVSAAPFHFWTPDVYQGAPTLFTAFMSTVVKTAGFAAIYRLLSSGFGPIVPTWSIALAVIAVVTLLIGNLIAITQTSFKRTMAYSSISHAGYMLIAIVAMNSFSQEAILYYSAAYTFATIAAFAVQHVVEQHHERDDFEIFHGIGKTNPFLALVGTVAMLSLAGIPLTGGFIGKLMVFTSAYQSGFGWLLIVAVLMSTVSMYYYLRLPIAMLLKKTVTEEKISVSPGASIVLWICLIGTVVLGLFPNLFTSLF